MVERTIDARKIDFLTELRKSGNVSAAARAAGISRSHVHQLRDADQAFRLQWDDALEESYDALEAEARRRGHDGFEEPVFYEGERVATIRRYSDTLLGRLLEANRAKFRKTSVEVSGPDGKPLEGSIDAVADKVASLLARAAARRAADVQPVGDR